MAESIVRQKSYDFALNIIRVCQRLKENHQFEIAQQLLRSGTSIGANVEEALAGQSRKDLFCEDVYRIKGGKRVKILVEIIEGLWNL